MKDEFIVRFVLRKGEGEAPKSHEIFENESLHDISKFYLLFDHEDINNTIIKSIDVLYDGITWLPDSEVGMIIEDEIIGFPSPILRFKTHGHVSEENFIQAVWHSSVGVCPKSREVDEAFYYEDHQGYTGIVSADDANILINEYEYLGKRGKCGLSLSDFDDGMKISDMFDEVQRHPQKLDTQ